MNVYPHAEHLPDVVDKGVVQEEDGVVGRGVQHGHVAADVDVHTAVVELQVILGVNSWQGDVRVCVT